MAGLAVARLRHHPAQAVLVATLAGIVALAGVLGVGYYAAVQESVQRQVLDAAPQSERGVSISASALEPPSPSQLRETMQPALRNAAWGTAVAAARADGLITARGRRVLVPVVTREGACANLQLDAGRCPEGAGEALVSRRTATQIGADVGTKLSVADAAGSGAEPVAALDGLEVVGVYRPFDPATAYWFDRPVGVTVPSTGATARALGVSQPPPPLGGDAVLLDWATLRSGRWRSLTTTLDVPLLPSALSVAGAPALRTELEGIRRVASAVPATTTTQLPLVLDRAAAERQRSRGPLPLLALQVVLLALVVLGYVAAATTEQRRPEVALARLRGQRPAAAAAAIVRELGPVVVVGCLLGGLAGWVAASVAARLWLVEGAEVPVRWQMVVAVGAAVSAGLVAVVVAAAPTVREPLVTLLRSVPPRSSALRAGLADGAVVAFCVAGLVTLLKGDPADPAALLAPGLLALAGGLVLSQAVVPLARLLGRHWLRRGRLSSALAAIAVARRPALRRLVAIVTVAVALLVFAIAATAVGADQRRVAAAAAVGAPVVLQVGGASPAAMRAAVAAADPGGGYATPVLQARSVTDEGPRTLAVDPASFGRVASWGRGGDGVAPGALSRLGAARPPAVEVRGGRVELTARLSTSGIEPTEQERDPTAEPPPVGLREPLTLHLLVVRADGRLADIRLGSLRPGTHTTAAAAPCADGCRVRRVEARRTFGDRSGALLDLTLLGLRDSSGEVDLRSGDGGWTRVSEYATVDFSTDPLRAVARSFGTDVVVQRLDVPPYPPALTVGALARTPYSIVPEIDPRELVSAPGLGGLVQSFRDVGDLAAVPGAPAPVALVSIRDVELDGEPDPGVLQQVWLSRNDPARQEALVGLLGARGVEVTRATTTSDVAAGLSRQGTGVVLRLAAMAGLIALLLATCVLGVSVATSGRVRSRDLAGLRLVGVPAGVVRRAAVREQLLVALVGVVSGSVLGAVGAALTLSRLRDAALPAPDVWAAGPEVVTTVTGCALVLGGVCAMLGRRLAERSTPSLLREETA